MIPTFIGVIQIVIGLAIIVAGSLRSAYMFLLLSCLFNGSAAVVLPALGNTSIAPVQFALFIVLLRMLMPGGGYAWVLPEAIQANKWLVLFTLYALAVAYVGPRIFAGAIDVTAMRPSRSTDLFATSPLKVSTQNLTSAFYIVGACLLSLVSFTACRFRGGAATLVTAFVVMAWAHIAIGLLGVVAFGTPFEAIFELFRNNTYAQLGHEYQGFVRIRGFSSEASSYGSLGFAIFVINSELWYRSIRPVATGRAALAMAVLLFFSTSSTAYAGLAIYICFFVARSFLLPRATEAKKLMAFTKTAFVLCLLSAILLAVVPDLASAVWDMIRHMTIDKPDSDSARQRLFWALQGRDAFFASYGFGVGPGSFRSSSFFMAVIGMTGIVGILSLLIHLVVVFQPWRHSSWGTGKDLAFTLGGACASAAILSLVPSGLSAASADPPEIFAILAGASLALRGYAHRSQPTGVSDASEAEVRQAQS